MTLALPDLTRPARPAFAARSLVDRVIRAAWVALGVLIMVAGVLISPLPGPMGLPIFVAGLILVLKASWWAKRQFVKMQKARPNWVFPVRRLLRKKPEFAPVFWQQILRVERMALKRGQRSLARRRRAFNARRA